MPAESLDVRGCQAEIQFFFGGGGGVQRHPLAASAEAKAKQVLWFRFRLLGLGSRLLGFKV